MGGSSTPKPVRITGMLEFIQNFGRPASPNWVVTGSANAPVIAGNPQDAIPTGPALLYYAVQWYFLNGGGPCYIVATASDALAEYNAGLSALANVDEPTLIVPCGAMSLSASDYHNFCGSALAQAQGLRDRFCILDVRNDTASGTSSQRVAADVKAFRDNIGSGNLSYGAAYYPNVATGLAWEYSDDAIQFNGAPLSDPSNKPAYAQLTGWLRGLRVTLPPSAGVAGVYATVDRDRGVWKAPANVSLSYAQRPVYAIDDAEQMDMNVPDGSSPVNAIRFFTGKGNLVWGARTLDYKAADWTYISVRRLFIMMEESIGKAIGAFVFEPNDKSTWTNAKSSIDGYLYQLWSQGALAGGKPEEAYQVHVGLGQTMTPADVKEGRMIVQISVAPVRPAEFVIITFTQNVQGA